MDDEILRIGLVQMTSVDSLELNREKIEEILASINPNSVDLICFPENCLYMRILEGETIPSFRLTDPCFNILGQWSRKLNAVIHLGSVPLLKNQRLYNTSVWIDELGSIHWGYSKRHLFDVEIPGRKPIKESDIFSRGDKIQIQKIKGWSLGESICYDIRFSEHFSEYAAVPVDAILVPSAFLVETGQAHWEVLLRARAIESQCYVIASAQVGTHISVKDSQYVRKTFGHSLIVDPWGRVELELGDNEGIGFLNITKQKNKIVREQIPMALHRRSRKDSNS